MVLLRSGVFASSLVALGLVSCVSDDAQNTSSGRPTSSSGSSSGSSGASSGGTSSSSGGYSSGGNSSGGGTAWDGTCDSTKPFGTPAEVLGINTQDNETRARISPDGRELYLSRYKSGAESWKLVKYSREDLLGAWGIDTPQPNLNPYEGPPGPSIEARTSSLAFVGPTEAFVSMLSTVQPTTIGVAVQKAAIMIWLRPTVVTQLNPGSDSPWFVPSPADPDEGRLYFSMTTDRDGGASVSSLYSAKRVSKIIDATTTTLLSVTRPSQDLYAPVLTADESLMYFGSGLSDRKIYVASRTSGVFNQPVELAALNIGTFNEPSWISGNGCEIYFTSNRNKDSNGVPHLDVFYARRPK
jgi:hypothetical protein